MRLNNRLAGVINDVAIHNERQGNSFSMVLIPVTNLKIEDWRQAAR